MLKDQAETKTGQLKTVTLIFNKVASLEYSLKICIHLHFVCCDDLNKNDLPKRS